MRWKETPDISGKNKIKTTLYTTAEGLEKTVALDSILSGRYMILIYFPCIKETIRIDLSGHTLHPGFFY